MLRRIEKVLVTRALVMNGIFGRHRANVASSGKDEVV
jgi:hypothetical protein